MVISDDRTLVEGVAEKASDDSLSVVAAVAQGAAVPYTAKVITLCTCLLFTEVGLPSLGLQAFFWPPCFCSSVS